MKRSLITFLCLFTALTSCTVQESAIDETPPSETPAENTALTSPQLPELPPLPRPKANKLERVPLSSIELTWRASTDKVDGFMIRYGFSREILTHTVRIPLHELTPVTHEGEEKVYRYMLRGVPSSSPLFVSVLSYQGELTSPLSETREIPPQ